MMVDPGNDTTQGDVSGLDSTERPGGPWLQGVSLVSRGRGDAKKMLRPSSTHPSRVLIMAASPLVGGAREQTRARRRECNGSCA
jgi:hypothetical protein